MTFKGIAKKRTLAFVITLCVCFSTWMVVPANAVTFNDVKTTDASYTAITWAVENGITNGVSEGVFAPQATCNNGQIITYLWRALGITIMTRSFGLTKRGFLTGQHLTRELPARDWLL